MSNKNLKHKYEKVYKDGKEDFFSRFEDGVDNSETDNAVWKAVDWSNKTVIDIGCGTGETALGIAKLGAKLVVGVDYSENAIKIANSRHYEDNLEFKVNSFEDVANDNINKYDVLLSCGTLEHMDNPSEVLNKMLGIIKNDGMIVLTCPYFINFRGIVWMTLALGMNVPMSLTDKHFISPFDIRDWLLGTEFKLLNTTYFDFDRANGQPMIIDMKKRLMNAFRDAKLPNERIPQLIDWLSKVVEEEQESLRSMNGSSALYIIGSQEAHD
jgi:ubiquinone biosynthesis O-methyltransferase